MSPGSFYLTKDGLEKCNLAVYFDNGSDHRKALRNASWDFGTGTISSSETIRSGLVPSSGQDDSGHDGSTTLAPDLHTRLPKILADAEREWQLVAGHTSNDRESHGDDLYGAHDENIKTLVKSVSL